MHESSERAEQSDRPNGQGREDPSVPARADGEDVLEAISAFEAQLQGLKKVQVERRKSEQDLLARQAAAAAREKELRTQFEQLRQDLSVIEQERAKVGEQQESLRGLAGEIEKRRLAVERSEADLARREEEARAAANAFERTREEASERSSKLEVRAQQLEQAEARLAAQAEKLSERIRTLERESEEASAKAAADARRAGEADGARARAESAVRALREELERVQREASELGRRMQARDAEVSELTARAEALAEQRLAFESDLAQRAEALAEAERLRAEVEERAAGRVRSLAEKLSAIEAASEQAGAQAEAARARIAELESEGSTLRKQMDEIRSARELEAEAVRSRIEGLSAELGSHEAEIARREQIIAELSTKLSLATDKIREFGDLVKNRVVAEDPRAAEALGKAIALNDQLGQRARELEEQIDRLESENRSLRERVSGRARQVTPIAPSDEVLSLRRARLSRVRLALREQTRKVRRANALLQERFDQCERLLGRRAELAAAHQAIQQQRERADVAKARTSTAGAVLAFVTTLAVLLGLSWVLAEQVHPGQYAASAAIEANGGDRGLSEQELGEWQAYHEQLIDDPRFVESVADLLKRRGLASLATPGALDSYLESGLTMQSPGDGRLELELRGDGATRTQRVLDTLVVAMARTGNRTRGRRLDGATTVVTDPASAGADSLDGARLTYAASIFGGGFLLTSALGALVWGRMARSKSRFEHDQHLEALLTDARWTDPRINIDGSAAGDTTGD